MMQKIKITYIVGLLILILMAGCQQEEMLSNPENDIIGGDVRINVSIDGFYDNTRGIMEESKVTFDEGELLHIRAVYKCEKSGVPYDSIQYGLMEYKGHGKWEAHTSSRNLSWPDEAKYASFEAYYFHGSTGELNENPMPVKLLSDYKFSEVPLSAKVDGLRYGSAVNLRMTHMFTYLTLTELDNAMSSELWFTVPTKYPDDYADADKRGKLMLNNAFSFKFDPDSLKITPYFSQVESQEYKDDNGNGLVFVKAKLNETVGENDISLGVSYLLQPGEYHKFNLLYPRSRTQYATYLSYNRDLMAVPGIDKDGLKANFRYVFSILKSLGIVIQEEPDDGWDEKTPPVKIDVEKFLRAVNSGNDYYEEAEDGTRVQILEKTPEGTRLMQNIDFNYAEYNDFGDDHFKAILSTMFDGNYHYIYHLGCPLFYANYGTITNVGIKDSRAAGLVSCEHLISENGYDNNTCNNGLIACYNYATVINVRVINAYMKVAILGQNSQEAHNASILFGMNRGNVYDLSLSGRLELLVENYGETATVIPRVNIGGFSGQNLGMFSGVSYVDGKDANDEDYPYAEIIITNNCQGSNGVYKVGGVTANNMGTLEQIFIPSLTIDCEGSAGLESYLGGIVGENPSSTSGSPRITGSIVRGEVKSGVVKPQLNLLSLSYTGGFAGLFNVQGIALNNSVSIDVYGQSVGEPTVEYGQGGVFGIIKSERGYELGRIDDLAWFGSYLTGPGAIGNFAGIVPEGFGWDYYSKFNINLQSVVGQNVGVIK